MTDTKIRQAKAGVKPFKLADGKGLYLHISPSGTKLWRYRYRIDGKENIYAIGQYPEIPLAEARRMADEARDLVRRKIHPASVRKREREKRDLQQASTLQVIAQEFIQKKRSSWSAGYCKQIERSLELDVYPILGPMPIREITPLDVLGVLRTMEERGAECLAELVRQWLSSIFRYAVITARADSDPAGLLRGAIQRPTVHHARAMSVADLRDFFQRLDSFRGHPSTRIGLLILLYTFVRTGEMRQARWSEFDFERKVWEIPAERMKRRRDHVVPLADPVVSLLKEQLFPLTGSSVWVFPSIYNSSKPMGYTTINTALEVLGYKTGEWTGHDFRATASTHLHEMGYPTEIIEMQLAHADGNKVRAVYNHAARMDERREMMGQWANWLTALRR